MIITQSLYKIKMLLFPSLLTEGSSSNSFWLISFKAAPLSLSLKPLKTTFKNKTNRQPIP